MKQALNILRSREKSKGITHQDYEDNNYNGGIAGSWTRTQVVLYYSHLVLYRVHLPTQYDNIATMCM